MSWFIVSANSILILLSAILISLIDIRRYRIPDALLAVTAFASIIFAIFFDRPSILNRFFISGGAFLSLYLFSISVKSGLGFGDIKFISVAAFNLGLFDTWIMLLSACILGILFSLTLKIVRKEASGENARIPFAPFLCLGILVSLFAKPPLF